MPHARFTSKDVRNPASSFLELATVRELETVDFGDSSFLEDYLSEAFQYVHHAGYIPERECEPHFFADAADKIQALVRIQENFGDPLAVPRVVGELDQSLLAYYRDNPLDLHAMPWRSFEKLVAELLASFGWDVHLTAPVKDGGYDIFAISSTTAAGMESSWIVECKRWAPERPVGVSAVRELYAVKSQLRAANALLATTSRFTKGVHEWAGSRYDLKLADFSRLVEWLNAYRPNPDGRLYLRDKRLVVPGST